MEHVKIELPAYCRSPKPIEPKAIVLHYFSAKNVEYERRFDALACLHLLLDLNRPLVEREYYMTEDSPWNPQERMYASYHFLIDRLGDPIEMIDLDRKAWHAGRSEYKGLKNWNDFSIGIGLIGDDEEPFTPAQYDGLIKLLKNLATKYQIPSHMIVGHETIAPGRKSDPGIATGNFDMKRVINGVYS